MIGFFCPILEHFFVQIAQMGLILPFGLRLSGPYFALGRDLASATFALGAVSMTGRSLLRCPCYAAPAVRSTVAS